ncbi:MAG: Nitrate/nitrite transporter [Candidatus Uhrbacteria bacterium GW2011_GWA2_52_8d]|uniref:Nitrate/nitrite transporter n=1 Tax=Candidatus Uhrbacteria bacterium GW2011_GWA2_52_8d TaxID=1618979 RepID=A0A0G2AJB5_9BACT|nr:MAG: Nitrate/nitrite transporter [Candidatus Uhrbacteria bacterium GW2011_GWA2_52_8d]
MTLHLDIKKYYLFRALLKRFVLPILVLYGLDRGLSLSELSIIAGAGSVVSFLLELPSGAIADRFGHRRTLVLSMLGQALSMAFYLGGSFWWMLLGAVAYMGFGSLMTGTGEAFFFERLQKLGLVNQHAKLSGQGKGFATAVSVISMALAGVFYEIAWWLPFGIGIIQFLLAAYVVSLIGPTKDEVSVEKKEIVQTKAMAHFGLAWQELKRQPTILWLILASSLVVGPLFAVGDFQQAIMNDVGISASLIGAIYALKRLLSIAMQGSVHHLMRIFAPSQLVLMCALLMLAHFFGMGLIQNPWWLLGPLIIGSLAWVGLEIAVNDYINQASQTSSRATLLSMNNFVRNLVGVLTIALYGLVTSSASAAYGFLVLGVILSILLIIPLWRLWYIRKF